MKSRWTAEEIVTHFTLQIDERTFIGINAPHNQLGKVILLKFFQYKARFPEDKSEIPQEAVTYLAQQPHLQANIFEKYQ